MNSNVIIDESAKQILAENLYKGKSYINTLDPVPVETYAKMQVSGADIIVPENIKKEVEILGVEGTYTEGGQPGSLTIVNNSDTYFKGLVSPYDLHSHLVFSVEGNSTGIIENISQYSELKMCLTSSLENYNFFFTGKYKGENYDHIALNYHDSVGQEYLCEPEETSERHTTWNFGRSDSGTIEIIHK